LGHSAAHPISYLLRHKRPLQGNERDVGNDKGRLLAPRSPRPLTRKQLCCSRRYLLPSHRKGGQSSMIFFHYGKSGFLARECSFNWQPQRSRDLRLDWLPNSLVCAALALSSCSSAATPASIQMVNPNTNQTLVCAARDELSRTDPAVLAVAVETCARSLEANGFIRQR
jgi:hypothetical protein